MYEVCLHANSRMLNVFSVPSRDERWKWHFPNFFYTSLTQCDCVTVFFSFHFIYTIFLSSLSLLCMFIQMCFMLDKDIECVWQLRAVYAIMFFKEEKKTWFESRKKCNTILTGVARVHFVWILLENVLLNILFYIAFRIDVPFHFSPWDLSRDNNSLTSHPPIVQWYTIAEARRRFFHFNF